LGAPHPLADLLRLSDPRRGHFRGDQIAALDPWSRFSFSEAGNCEAASRSILKNASTIGVSTNTGRARSALEASELGALLVFDVNSIRYLTSTKIGEWERDKLSRWALLVRSGEPILWDFGSAAVHRESSN
jgi:hypothetical protein